MDLFDKTIKKKLTVLSDDSSDEDIGYTVEEYSSEYSSECTDSETDSIEVSESE